MKTVKFRIWNGMEMVYDITTGKFGTFYVNPEKGDGINHEGTPLMQYTGLKDKNDKEIYEGDILKTATDKPMVVGWSEKFASFVLNRNGWAFSHWFGESCNPEDCEIIGNKYQNAVLLQDTV